MTPGPAEPNLTSIVVTPPSPSLIAGQTQQFIATGIYNNGSSQDLTFQVAWTSSDPTIATIDSGGLATSLIDGMCVIRARSGGITGTTNLTVAELALVALSVVPATLALQAGQTQQFMAVGTYSDSSQQDLTADVTWAVADATVATITSSGFATAVAGGATDILAESGVLSGSAALSVTDVVQTPPPDSGTQLPPVIPGSPADYLRQAQQAMFQLLLGNKPSRVDTPQLGAVEFVATTPAQLQRAIDYLQGLVQSGNLWPIDGSSGSMNSGYTRGRKPFSFYGWP